MCCVRRSAELNKTKWTREEREVGEYDIEDTMART